MDPDLNTATRVWFEFGPTRWDTDEGTFTHDTRWDDGAHTWEAAIIAVAQRVHEAYGNDRRLVDANFLSHSPDGSGPD